MRNDGQTVEWYNEFPNKLRPFFACKCLRERGGGREGGREREREGERERERGREGERERKRGRVKQRLR